MPDYLKQLETILMVLLGWLLGLWTPSLAERIRRPRRRRELVRSVLDEMLGLQHTMAVAAHRIRERRAEVSDAFLDEILPIVEGYEGPDRSQGFVEGIRESRKLPEGQRAVVHRTMRKLNVGLTLPQYAIPLFITQIADLTICDLDFQRSVLHIRSHLDLYNQIGPYTRSLWEKTFNNPKPEDLAALITNLEEAYRDAGIRAEIIVRAIRELQQRYGTSK